MQRYLLCTVQGIVKAANTCQPEYEVCLGRQEPAGLKSLTPLQFAIALLPFASGALVPCVLDSAGYTAGGVHSAVHSTNNCQAEMN